jgi:hypothetical protein
MREERRCPCYLEEAVTVMMPRRIVRSRLDRLCEARWRYLVTCSMTNACTAAERVGNAETSHMYEPHEH